MGRSTKRFREIAQKVDTKKKYTFKDSIELLKQCPSLKFDESVDISLRLGIDPRKSDQSIRGTVSLPNGTGKTLKVIVFAKGDKIQEALDAGADFAGDKELLDKVKSGWTGFDVAIATPDMMREVGKMGKILGPRGLMPSPKAGTVTKDVALAVNESKSGKIEFKADKSAVINTLVGKLSFDTKNLEENIMALLQAIARLKPASAKGQYMQSLTVSSTMGPGIAIETKEFTQSS